MNSPSLSPGRQAYLLAVRRQKRQVRLWQAALLAGLLALYYLRRAYRRVILPLGDHDYQY